MGKFIITEDEKKHIKGLYEQKAAAPQQAATTAPQQAVKPQQAANPQQTVIPLVGDIKFVINNTTSYSAGKSTGGFKSQLGEGKFIILNNVPDLEGGRALEFLNMGGSGNASVTIMSNKTGFYKNGTLFSKVDDRLIMDVIALICNGFYGAGSVNETNVLNVLNSISTLLAKQSRTLRAGLSANLTLIMTTMRNLKAMTAQQFTARYPTNLEKNQWNASGADMKVIYTASLKFNG